MALRYDSSMVALASGRYARNKSRARFGTGVKALAVLLFGGLAVANIAQGKVTVVVVALLAMAALGFYLLTVDIRAARVAGRR